MIDSQDSIYLGVASPNPEKDMSNYYTKAQTRALVDTKQDVITGAATTITDNNLTANRAVISNANGKLDVSDTTSTELEYVHGVTSAIQTQLNGKANISLNNLSSNGQMVIDSQNGTISNCVLEIPQNLNLTLSNNVLTLKKGSVGVVCTSTYTTVTVANDVTITLSQADGTYVIFLLGAGSGLTATLNSKVSSGSSLPETGLNGDRFFNTTDKQMYYHNETEWVVSSLCYPVCLIQITSGVAGFVKFSDGRDCIFNGIGFVGQTKFIYPNFKVLQPIGKNADGTLKSKEFTNNSLQLSTSGDTYNRRMFFNSNTFQITANNWHYHEDENIYYNQDGNPFVNGCIELGNCFTVNGIVTDFTISQPIKLVTNEMMDKKADDNDVVKLTGNQTVAGVKTFTANPVISNAHPQMQFVDSDFSKGTVPLSALRNTFFVLRDSTNLESGDMGSLFQRVDEYGNNYIAIVAFKNTSGSNDNEQLGIYYNIDGTSYATCPNPPAGDNSRKIATTKWVNDYFASITGYDATKTQTLKNVNGTLTWVDD